MSTAIESFRNNILSVRHLGALHDAVNSLTTSAVNCDDILRSQIVLAVSAFDHFIHELVRIGILESFAGTRPRTDAYCRFQVPLQAAHSGLAAGGESWLSEQVRQKHSYQTFQNPDNVADAVRLICPKKLWVEVGAALGISDSNVKAQLRLLVERRNKIAHEADTDPSYPGQRWPIDKNLVDDATNFLSEISEAIFLITR